MAFRVTFISKARASLRRSRSFGLRKFATEEKTEIQAEEGTTQPNAQEILKNYTNLPQASRVPMLKEILNKKETIAELEKNPALTLELAKDYHEMTGSQPAVLKDLVKKQFNLKNLKLIRLTWAKKNKEILQKIQKYEQVHPVENLKQLRERFLKGKRIYMLIHPRVPHEPLSFVNIAFLNSIPNSMEQIFKKSKTPTSSSSCIFYSITAPPRGISDVAEHLLKRVSRSLKKKHKNLVNFVTISPIVNFRHWLQRIIEKESENVFASENLRTLSRIVHNVDAKIPEESEGYIEGMLMNLCARYLMVEKHKDQRALDPVCNFHMKNGAILLNLHWKADPSPLRWKQSLGIMANYLYKRTATNAALYKETGHVTADSHLRIMIPLLQVNQVQWVASKTKQKQKLLPASLSNLL